MNDQSAATRDLGRDRLASAATSAARWAALLLIASFVPLFAPEYVQALATRMLIFAIVAMSLDLLVGYGGLLSFGHAAFFGIGGYVAGLLMVKVGVTSAWVALPAAMAVAGAFAAIAGVIALRVAGVYFLLVTFALGELAHTLSQRWSYLATGGATGVAGIRYPTVEPLAVDWTTSTFYLFVLAICAATYIGLSRVVRSPFGRALAGVKRNEPRMRALGYDAWYYKYATFVLAGTVAGLAGALFVYSDGIAVPANLSVVMSGTVFFMVLIGGSGHLYGAILGAVVLTAVQFFASVYAAGNADLVLGIVFVIVVMFGRNGIVNTPWATIGRRLRHSPAGAATQ